MKRLGAGKALVSESAQTRSAGAVLLFVPARSTSDFDVGRRFYRLWLEVTAAGLCLAPMSALADSPEHNAALCARYAVPAERRLANVLRVGVAPSEPARSPRLPAGELAV
jgi:hypothetical protein